MSGPDNKAAPQSDSTAGSNGNSKDLKPRRAARKLARDWLQHGLARLNLGWLVRRIGWLLAIFFGVILVTFGAVHLAPGEIPAGRTVGGLAPQATDSRELEIFRRTHNLHLPVFLNLDIADRHRQIKNAIARFVSAENGQKRAAARRLLLRRTTLSFPELPRAVRRTQNHALAAVLWQIFKVIGLPALPLEQTPAVLWNYWKQHRMRFARNHIRRTVHAALHRHTPQSVRWTLRFHRRAVPALIAALEEPNTEVQARACRLLGRISGRKRSCAVDMDPAQRATAIALWQEYHRRQKLDHIDVSGWDRVIGAVTQTRFFNWLRRFVTLKLGVSLYYHRPVVEVIGQRLPVTLTLGLAALFLAYLLAVPLGVLAGRAPGGHTDRVVAVGTMVFYCLPVFWVAMTLMIHLGGIRGPALFPHSGIGGPDPARWPLGSWLLDRLWHMVLPVCCLAYGSLALLTRYGRDAMAGVLAEDYMRTAWAKGLSPRQVYWKHGLKNASLPLIHLLGLQIPYLLSGSVIVEKVFDIPGLGLLAFTAIEMRDFNLLMGLVVVTALLTLGGQTLADLLAAVADPRLRRRPAAGRSARFLRATGGKTL